eukprot:s996_g6.t1
MQYWSCHSYWEFGSCKSLLTLSNTEVPPGCEGGTGTWLIPPGIASIPCTGWPKAAIMDEPGQYLGVNKDGVAFARRQARPSCMFSHIHRTCPFLAPALESNGEHWGDMPRCASPTDEPFVTVSGDLTLYRDQGKVLTIEPSQLIRNPPPIDGSTGLLCPSLCSGCVVVALRRMPRRHARLQPVPALLPPAELPGATGGAGPQHGTAPPAAAKRACVAAGASSCTVRRVCPLGQRSSLGRDPSQLLRVPREG